MSNRQASLAITLVMQIMVGVFVGLGLNVYVGVGAFLALVTIYNMMLNR